MDINSTQQSTTSVQALQSVKRARRKAAPAPGAPTVTLEEVRALQARAMGERRDLQPAVMRALASAGWLSYHTWNSQHSTAGFPDVVAILNSPLGPISLLVAELKSETGKVTAAQQRWLDEFRRFGDMVNLLGSGMLTRVEIHVWRPSHWLSGEIEAVIYRHTGMTVAGKRGWGMTTNTQGKSS